MTFYDVLCQWNKETEIVIKCRKLSWHVVNCRDVCRKLSWHFFSRPLPAVPFWISPIYGHPDFSDWGIRVQVLSFRKNLGFAAVFRKRQKTWKSRVQEVVWVRWLLSSGTQKFPKHLFYCVLMQSERGGWSVTDPCWLLEPSISGSFVLSWGLEQFGVLKGLCAKRQQKTWTCLCQVFGDLSWLAFYCGLPQNH